MNVKKLGLVSLGLLLLSVLSIASPTSAKSVVSIPIGSGSNTSSPGYSPTTITVVIGVNDTVIWVNNDNTTHTATADSGSAFNSGDIAPNQSYMFTFATAGTYAYHCTYHSWMHGTVIVKSGSAVPEFPVSTLALIFFGVVAVAALVSGRFRQRISTR